jgi:transposase
MERTDCPGCAARDARIAELERRIAVLEARLGANSTNSSVPPSANPLGAPKPVTKKKSKRKPGGQPGHPPHLKALLPPERVNHTIAFVPSQCARCQAPLPQEPSPQDPAPTRFQAVELPPLVAVVTEYQGQARTCPDCGAVTHQPIPQGLLAHSVGPRLTATLSYFTGCHGVSKRGVEEIAAAVFDAPVSLGTVANLEQEVSAALAAPHEEAVAAVRAAAVKHADETSWKLRGRLCWLWTAATAKVVAFLIHARRGAAGLTALLGAAIAGILCSDRWSVYDRVPAKRRQLCWAHLKRDFQKILDRGGSSVFVGRRGRLLVKKVFAAWQAFREGQATRAQLQDQLAPLMNRMQRLLLEGAILGEDARVAAFCENLLALEPALWTFAEVEGVEPTNNFMERLLRRAVLWRKRSFGSWSAAGCRFVERILTVVQTCRLQGKHALDYLQEALVAHRSGQPCPKLLPEG